jgi:predicted small integral membrane protein
MDTTQNQLKYSNRAITSPLLHHRIFWLIITLEIMYTLFCTLGAYFLYKNINTSKEAFHEAKKFAVIGLLIALFIYYVCFQAIGVEWFNMDESKKWNYRDWGRQAVDFIMLSLIYIALPIES